VKPLASAQAFASFTSLVFVIRRFFSDGLCG